MSYILYQLPSQPVAVVSPSGEVPIEELIPRVVPAGANYKIVETVPVYDPTVYELVLTPEGSPEPYQIIPLPLTESKGTYTSETKAKAYSILQPTDWLVVRQVEDSVPIPTEWQEWRQAVRLESSTKIAAIEACGTSEELHEYMNSEAYSTWPTSPDSPDAP